MEQNEQLAETEIEEDIYEEEDAQKDKYLTFELGGEGYGLDISYVTEIIGIQNITEVPDMPEFIKGVINLRGKVIPVMDMRARFHMPFREYDERTCIVVVDVNNTSIGLVVDEVSEVADIPESQVEPPPQTTKKGGNNYLKGMGKIDEEVKILLDVQQIMAGEEMENMNLAA